MKTRKQCFQAEFNKYTCNSVANVDPNSMRVCCAQHHSGSPGDILQHTIAAMDSV